MKPLVFAAVEPHLSTWDSALERFRVMRPRDVAIWFKELKLLRVDGDTWVLGVPHKFYQEWFCNNLLPQFTIVLETLTGRKPSFRFEILPEDLPPAATNVVPIQAAAQENAPRKLHPKLNESYTFDRFVVGESNKLAYSAAFGIAEGSSSRFNPLYIHGGSGLGKTHLLHAIGHQAYALRGEKVRITYVTSEQFLNEYVSATRPQTHGMQEFRERYRRSCDILLVDDIQFISGNKDATQEEFFHTFNALYEAGKFIVITSDRFPKEIPGIEDRLRTRFLGGLIVQIVSPDYTMRLDILRKKARDAGILVAEDVIDLIAENVKSNVRELEGALHHIEALASLTKSAIDVDIAREAIQNILKRREDNLTVEEIIRVVSTFFNVRPQDIKSHRRHKQVTTPRQIAMYLCRKHLKLSYPDIGVHFGGKDHSTVISSVRKIEQKLGREIDFKNLIDSIETRLSSR